MFSNKIYDVFVTLNGYTIVDEKNISANKPISAIVCACRKNGWTAREKNIKRFYVETALERPKILARTSLCTGNKAREHYYSIEGFK